ncbi:unnamed protein product [Camellia sinensis]
MSSSCCSGFLLNESDDYDDDDVAEKSPSGRYLRYNEVLDRGPRNTVYKGFDLVDGMEVTWNKVTVDDSFQSEEHMRRLNTLLKPLKHKNIIKSCSSWVDHQSKTINMISEFFTSGSLRLYSQKHRSVDIIAIKNWARQILQGLCYLHTRDLPIVHGDLTCQNIFVNGNSGQVKIGYTGLPTTMLQTPELDGEGIQYSPVVDIHSFGLCMLELVTSEYPYSYSDGKTQALLTKVKDIQVKDFIEKCIFPVSTMFSAAELLKDPFFEIPAFTTCVNDTPDLVSVLEFKISNEKSEFRLRGERVDENSISLTLRIADTCGGQMTKIEFMFNVDADTTLSIAWEMVEQLDLPKEDATLIAELMDNVIMKMVPCWMPSSVRFSGVKCSYGDPILVDYLFFQLCAKPSMCKENMKKYMLMTKNEVRPWVGYGMDLMRPGVDLLQTMR